MEMTSTKKKTQLFIDYKSGVSFELSRTQEKEIMEFWRWVGSTPAIVDKIQDYLNHSIWVKELKFDERALKKQYELSGSWVPMPKINQSHIVFFKIGDLELSRVHTYKFEYDN
jgi:hypothetical protein